MKTFRKTLSSTLFVIMNTSVVGDDGDALPENS